MVKIVVRNIESNDVSLIEVPSLPVDMSQYLPNGSYYTHLASGTSQGVLEITNGVPGPPWTDYETPRISAPDAIAIPADVNEFWIPVTISQTRVKSAAIRLGLRNAFAGGGINVGDGTFQRQFLPQRVYRWSPGDDLLHWVRIVRPQGISFAHGNSMVVRVMLYGAGGTDGRELDCIVTFSRSAEAQEITPTAHRPLRRLNLAGADRSYALDPLAIRHHDTGYIDGNPVWRSRPSHGYSQPGNTETGLYTNDDVEAFAPVRDNPITTGTDAFGDYVQLHTYAYDTPFTFEGEEFRHQAVMLTGERIDEVCGPGGVWLLKAITPSRHYAWPAFWLVGRNENTDPAWPPEVDIMEQYNQAWGTDFPMNGFYNTAGQHWGNWHSNNRRGADAISVFVNELPTLGNVGSLWEEPHTYAAAIDTENNEVVFFVDGVEFMTQKLVAQHQDMRSERDYLPIFNVAVRAPAQQSAADYNADGSGDMRVYGLEYYPSGWSYDDITT